MDFFIADNKKVLNLDINPPQKSDQHSYWRKCDINDECLLQKEFENFCPDYLVHLAARTDPDGKTLADYRTNIQGTANILQVCKNSLSVKRVIITSSQLVHFNRRSLPVDDNDFLPYTIYGESKVLTEKLTRAAKLSCAWTIIRPTRVWGYWQPDRLGFYKLLYNGRYIHPGRKPVKRAFGYVGNVVYQVNKILETPAEVVDKRVFYVGDIPANLIDWVEGFAKRINNKRVIYLPRYLVKFIAKCGDIIKTIGFDFPLYSYRYESLVTDDDAPMKLTFDTFGEPPFTLEESIDETVNLIRFYHPEFNKPSN